MKRTQKLHIIADKPTADVYVSPNQWIHIINRYRHRVYKSVQEYTGISTIYFPLTFFAKGVILINIYNYSVFYTKIISWISCLFKNKINLKNVSIFEK